MKNINLAVIAGDGIGPEVVAQGLRILDKVAAKYDVTFAKTEYDLGAGYITIIQHHFIFDKQHDLCKEGFDTALASICQGFAPLQIGMVGLLVLVLVRTLGVDRETNVDVAKQVGDLVLKIDGLTGSCSGREVIQRATGADDQRYKYTFQ